MVKLRSFVESEQDSLDRSRHCLSASLWQGSDSGFETAFQVEVGQVVDLVVAFQVASLSLLATIYQSFVWRQLDEEKMTSKPAGTYDRWRQLFVLPEVLKSLH